MNDDNNDDDDDDDDGLELHSSPGQNADSDVKPKVGATKTGPPWNMHLALLFANFFNDMRY